MAFPRLSASMLLASLILLLYWTTSSADLSATSREKRDLPFKTRDQVKATVEVAKDLLSTLKDTSEVKKFAESTKKGLKILSKFASTAPGVVGVLFSVVNMALAFTSQVDPVMDEVKKGFAEVNRKLDSLSIQISNLATDVKWYNYVSVYSQDELRILYAWRKFNKFIENSNSTTNPEEKLQLAEIFINYYEYTGTEASVANFYHYLTIGSMSLSENLNKLLVEKFECDISEMAKYNFYFNTLLLEGMVLNQAYWKLIGVRTSINETEMFKNVYNAQRSAVDFCLNNIEHYMKKDVEEISKALSHDNKQAVAVEVKKKLDEKYDWYNWVVLVYNTDDDSYYMLHDLTKIPVGTITIAVGFTRKASVEKKKFIKKTAESDNCFKQGSVKCVDVQSNLYHKDSCVETLPQYSNDIPDFVGLRVRDYVNATHIVYGNKFAEVPEPFLKYGCKWGGSGEIFLHYSKRKPDCSDETCNNGGTCKLLLDSNDGLCECQDGYYGDSCEEKMNTTLAKKIDAKYPVTIITGMQSRLRTVENKLDNISNTINYRCQLRPYN